MYDVIHANTGSSAKIKAVRVEVVCFCAQLCTANASAVANKAVVSSAVMTAPVQTTRTGSIHQYVAHPDKAATAICVKLKDRCGTNFE